MGTAKGAIPDVVRAKRFELVDSDGKVRAVLGFESDGEPALVLLDSVGHAKWRAKAGRVDLGRGRQ